jgi:hypothetical protein
MRNVSVAICASSQSPHYSTSKTMEWSADPGTGGARHSFLLERRRAMAESANQAQDSWSTGMAKLMEAGRTQMTAYNLAVAGAVVLTAGATAYFWDQTRRNAFLDGAQRFTDQMRDAWGLGGSPSRGDETPPGHA